MSVEIVEVGPRDGLQNQAETLSPADKIDFIERLIAAGALKAGTYLYKDPTLDPISRVLGLHGVLVNGTTGEWFSQTDDERRLVAETVIEHVAGRVRQRARAAQRQIDFGR